MLPTELWKQVFALTDKHDIKTCLLVSKSWYYIARSFFSQDIRINLDDGCLHRLSKDIKEHAGLCPKISRITINHSSTGTASPDIFRAIVNLCPNLRELMFEITDAFHYLKSLNCKEALLPNIQKIHVRGLLECSPAVRRFHLWVNYRFRATIASLEIMDIKDNAALKDYGGLVKFASCFPQLTSLKAKCNTLVEKELNINLTELLKNNSHLQELKLYGIGKITNTLNELAPSVVEYPSLKKFKLEVSDIHIKSLDYITKRFTQLQSLRLLTSTVVPDRSLDETQANDILNTFKAFAIAAKHIHVSYEYKDEHFHQNNGKRKPPSWVTQNFLFLDGFNRQYFLEFLDDDGHGDDLDDQDYFNAFDEQLTADFNAGLFDDDYDDDVDFNAGLFDDDADLMYTELYDDDVQRAEDLMYPGLYDDDIEDDDPGFASFFMDYYSLY